MEKAGTGVGGVGLGVGPGLDSQLCYCQPCDLSQASHFTSLSLSILSCRTGEINPPRFVVRLT